ncbi:hypothetical protein GQ457_02G030800 [Hibiscus cannabinus]
MAPSEPIIEPSEPTSKPVAEPTFAIPKQSQTFSSKKVSVVLDESNFLTWKQQVLLAVRSLRLEKLLTGALTPPPATVVANGRVVENVDHEIFVAQDSALASWLLSTISPQLLPEFVGADTAAKIWTTVLKFFSSRSTTTVMSLQYRLRSVKKGDQSMRAYVAQIKEICNLLASSGSPISDLEKIATILNGLPMEYQPFVAIITASRDPFTLDAAIFVLFDAETQLNSFNPLSEVASSLNVAVAGHPTETVAGTCSGRPYRSNVVHCGRGRSGRIRLQCQLCGKLGHLVDRCWHRFDEGFVPITTRNKGPVKAEDKVVNLCALEPASSACACHCVRAKSSPFPEAEILWHMRPTNNQDTHSIVDMGPSATSGAGEEDTHPIADTLPTSPSTIEAGCCTRAAPCAPVDSAVLPRVNGVQSPELATSISSTQNLSTCHVGVSHTPCVETQVSEPNARANLPCVDLPRVEAVNGVHGQGEQPPITRCQVREGSQGLLGQQLVLEGVSVNHTQCLKGIVRAGTSTAIKLSVDGPIGGKLVNSTQGDQLTDPRDMGARERSPNTSTWPSSLGQFEQSVLCLEPLLDHKWGSCEDARGVQRFKQRLKWGTSHNTDWSMMAPPEIAADLVDADPILEAQIFSNKRVNVCLTDSNFLLWKQQVVLTIRGLGLEGYLDGTISTPIKMIRNRSGEQVLNPAYIQHLKQDSSLASWLLSTISANILPQLVGSETTASVWNDVTKLYSSLSTTKIMNLHYRLRSMKKVTQSMREYTTAIKELCDLLSSCGNPIFEIEQVATILNGLPIDYEPSVAAITASRDSFSVENVVSILIDAESRLEDTSRFPVGINMTRYNSNVVVQDNNAEIVSQKDKSEVIKSGSGQAHNRFKGRPRHQCQLCGKLGHLVDRCWHRFDQTFKGVSAQSRSFSKPQANVCSCAQHEVSYEPYTYLPAEDSNKCARGNDDDDAQVNVLTVDGPLGYAKWFPDSGATHHVTGKVSSLSSVSTYHAQNSAQQQGDSSRGNVPTTEGITQATTNIHSEHVTSQVEPQSFTEETSDDVAGSQSSERSLKHNANSGSLESMDANQSVHVADQAVEGSEGVVNQGQVEDEEDVSNQEPAAPNINVHPMITRRKAGIFKPKVYAVQVTKVPMNVDEALDDEGWRMAVFLRTGQKAELDTRRSEVLGRSASIIQRKIRSYLAHRSFIMRRRSALKIQYVCRGQLAHKIYDGKRREATSLRIQRHLRMHLARKAYKDICLYVVSIQTVMRGWLHAMSYASEGRQQQQL